MTICYYGAPFNLQALHVAGNLGSLKLNKTSFPEIDIDLLSLVGSDYNSVDTQTFWHFQTAAAFAIQSNDIVPKVRYPTFALYSLGKVLKDALNLAAAANSWPTADFDVIWSESVAPHYQITYGSSFNYEFTTSHGQRLFGGLAGPLGPFSTSSNLSNHELGLPSHTVALSMAEGGNPAEFALPFITPTGDASALRYEPGSISSEVVSDSGIGYGAKRYATSLFQDWEHRNCRFITVYGRHNPLDTSWSFREMFDYCRSQWPFYVAHGGFGTGDEYPVFKLRGDKSSLVPRARVVGLHERLDIPFGCRAIGALTVAA